MAQQAISKMGLHAITIGIVPKNQAGKVGIIGLPSWMWVADPGPQTTGPQTATATQAGYTVTATATLNNVVWNTGDGSTVTCQLGTPYNPAVGAQPSPDCGHTYTRQGTYTVTATSSWTVAWSGVGQTGTIPLTFTQSTTIQEAEVQVLTTSNGGH